jgi:GNAT superfamily N-acetyltransferase
MSLQSTAPAPSAPADALPALSTYTASIEDDRIDGLKLVADSVAQQRQVSSKMLIFHPANLALYAVLVAILVSYLQRAGHDWIMIGTLLGGLTMSCFAAVRWAAGGYIGLAEEINWEWLGEDRLIIVKWGEEIIGALVLGWADSELKKKGGRRKRGKAVVRAWTVKLKYRGKGIGEALLEEAVKVAGEKGADGIVFDAEHASKSTLSVMLGCNSSLLTVTQILNGFFPHSIMDFWIREKRGQRRLSRRWPMRRAISDSAGRRRLGAADEYCNSGSGYVHVRLDVSFIDTVPHLDTTTSSNTTTNPYLHNHFCRQ